ncbi:unnamed protein product, partial [Mycena citricolor]
ADVGAMRCIVVVGKWGKKNKKRGERERRREERLCAVYAREGRRRMAISRPQSCGTCTLYAEIPPTIRRPIVLFSGFTCCSAFR